jgi:hypothetical protein
MKHLDVMTLQQAEAVEAANGVLVVVKYGDAHFGQEPFRQ